MPNIYLKRQFLKPHRLLTDKNLSNLVERTDVGNNEKTNSSRYTCFMRLMAIHLNYILKWLCGGASKCDTGSKKRNETNKKRKRAKDRNLWLRVDWLLSWLTFCVSALAFWIACFRFIVQHFSYNLLFIIIYRYVILASVGRLVCVFLLCRLSHCAFQSKFIVFCRTVFCFYAFKSNAAIQWIERTVTTGVNFRSHTNDWRENSPTHDITVNWHKT